MTDVYKLFKEEIWMPEDLTNCIWCERYGEIFWNTQNNIEHLKKWRWLYVLWLCYEWCSGERVLCTSCS